MSDRTHHEYQDGPWTAVAADGFLALVEPDAPWRLVDGLWQVARDGGDVLGALGVVAADGFASLPAFAVLRADGDGAVHAVLRGPVRLRLHGVDGTQEVAAGDGAVWTEHRALGVQGLELVVDDVPDATWWPLTGGVVRSGGLRTGAVPEVAEAAPVAVPDTATHEQPVVPERAVDVPARPVDAVVDVDAVPGGVAAAAAPLVAPGVAAPVVAPVEPDVPTEPADVLEPEVLTERADVLEPHVPAERADVLEPEVPGEPAEALEPDVPTERADALEPDVPTLAAPDVALPELLAPEPDEPDVVDPWAPAASTASAPAPVVDEPAGTDLPAVPVEPDLPTERLSPEELLEAAGPPAWSEAESTAWSTSVPAGTAEPATPDPEPVPDIPWWPLGDGAAAERAPVAPVAAAPATAVAEEEPGSDDHDGMTILSSDLARLRDRLPAWSQDAEAGPFPVPQPAPLAARMVLSTGLVVALDRAVLLGRAPQVARVSNRELPRLVTVPSPNQDISRTHAEVRVEGDHVIVTDLDSTNGVHVSRPGEGVRRLHPGEPSVIGPDEVVDLGDGVTFTVERSAS